jgi:hypothetical protein
VRPANEQLSHVIWDWWALTPKQQHETAARVRALAGRSVGVDMTIDELRARVTLHDLKTLPQPFEAVWDCRKRHEVRVFDRPFAVGHWLRLREYDPGDGAYSGREVVCSVTHITPPGDFGLPENVGVMSIREEERREWR